MSEYDPIARRYERDKSVTWREVVERPTFLALLGDVRGLRVLDLGCGSGHFTRIMRRAGAAHTVGVDASSAMIERAREHEAQDALGIEYQCLPAQRLGVLDSFDVVTAAYLLNHASSRDELRAMLDAIVRNLRVGGRFVALNSAMDHEAHRDLRRYGLRARIGDAPREGQAFRVEFFDDEGRFEVVNHHWHLETYERAMTDAGLGAIAWSRVVKVEPTAAAERGHWDDLVARPPFIGLTARRVR